MRVIQENDDGSKVIACGVCGSMFNVGPNDKWVCPTCGDTMGRAADQMLASMEVKAPPPERPNQDGTARCKICGAGATYTPQANKRLEQLCDGCIDMLHAINSSVQEMVQNEIGLIAKTVMRKLRGKGNPQLVLTLLGAFQLEERL